MNQINSEFFFKKDDNNFLLCLVDSCHTSPVSTSEVFISFFSCPLGLMLHEAGSVLEKHHYEKAEAVILPGGSWMRMLIAFPWVSELVCVGLRQAHYSLEFHVVISGLVECSSRAEVGLCPVTLLPRGRPCTSHCWRVEWPQGALCIFGWGGDKGV